MTKIPLIVVAGATASGKTGLAIDLANKFDGEIVSADSMQIYKYMDIGTAKPTKSEREAARHHLIDFVDPKDSYSVARYSEAAHKVIADIVSRGKIPIMCGGTGLYINSVVNDVAFGEVDSDPHLREELWRIAEEKGNGELVKILSEFDKKSADTIHPNNTKRLIRAIEFYRLTQTPISEHQEMTRLKDSRYYPIMLSVEYARDELYERINKRVDIMMSAGLLDEVKALRAMGLDTDAQSMQGIGYKELFLYLENKCSLDAAVDMIKQGSRNYAKRQLTWFRRDDRINKLNPTSDIAHVAAQYISERLYM